MATGGFVGGDQNVGPPLLILSQISKHFPKLGLGALSTGVFCMAFSTDVDFVGGANYWN